MGSNDAERGNDIALTLDGPLSTPAITGDTTVETFPVVIGTTVDYDRTQPEGPHHKVA